MKANSIGGSTMSTQIKITHTFNAPCELVFKAFTESEPKELVGSKRMDIEVSKSDLHPGGVFHYSRKPADSNVMGVKFLYNEIISRAKIVYTSFFSDEGGNTVRAPFDENWPMEILDTIMLTKDEDKTTLTMIVAPVLLLRKRSKPTRIQKRWLKKVIPEPLIN